MNYKSLLPLLVLGLLTVSAFTFLGPASGAAYTAMDGIVQGNLTIFPVLAAEVHDTDAFLTLDEGIRSGAVVVSELGGTGMMRPESYAPAAEVNRLALDNESDRPLLLLGGEIVSGGKQDRIVARDRIVPPHSGPIDLSVFCVEPERWTQVSSNFNGVDGIMAAPSVRSAAIADQNQGEVWDQVRSQSAAVAAAPTAPPPLPRNSPPTAVGTTAGTEADEGHGFGGSALGGGSSYLTSMSAPEAERKIESVAAPIDQSFSELRKTLHNRNAVGVVVAVNGRIVWADLFASPDLLQRYWEKLLASYAAESVAQTGAYHGASRSDAQAFVDQLEGLRETSETVPNLYRESEGTAPGFTVFHLTSLLPKTEFDLHIAKVVR